jgi:hypothetical protein
MVHATSNQRNFSGHVNNQPFSCTLAKAERVAADINAAGGKAIAVPGDITDAAFPDRLIKSTIE